MAGVGTLAQSSRREAAEPGQTQAHSRALRSAIRLERLEGVRIPTLGWTECGSQRPKSHSWNPRREAGGGKGLPRKVATTWLLLAMFISRT